MGSVGVPKSWVPVFYDMVPPEGTAHGAQIVSKFTQVRGLLIIEIELPEDPAHVLTVFEVPLLCGGDISCKIGASTESAPLSMISTENMKKTHCGN